MSLMNGERRQRTATHCTRLLHQIQPDLLSFPGLKPHESPWLSPRAPSLQNHQISPESHIQCSCFIWPSLSVPQAISRLLLGLHYLNPNTQASHGTSNLFTEPDLPHHSRLRSRSVSCMPVYLISFYPSQFPSWSTCHHILSSARTCAVHIRFRTKKRRPTSPDFIADIQTPWKIKPLSSFQKLSVLQKCLSVRIVKMDLMTQSLKKIINFMKEFKRFKGMKEKGRMM